MVSLISVLSSTLHVQSLTNTEHSVKLQEGLPSSSGRCIWIFTRELLDGSYQGADGLRKQSAPYLAFLAGGAHGEVLLTTKWVVTLSSRLPKQVVGGIDGTACRACLATTALSTAVELGWERLIHHSDLLWRQPCGDLRWCWDLALPCCVKGKFHTAFATTCISFPQSWIWCLPRAQHSLSTEINWSRQQGRGN